MSASDGHTPTLLASLSLAIMQKACGVPEHTSAELLPDRISIDLPELDAAIDLAIREHCNSHAALAAALERLVAALEKPGIDALIEVAHAKADARALLKAKLAKEADDAVHRGES